MIDTVLLEAKRRLEASSDMTDEEYGIKMSYLNDEESIDDLNFEKIDYDILKHVVFD